MAGMDFQDLCITLVPGTWARGWSPNRDPRNELNEKRFWFGEGSSFRKQIESALQSYGIRHEIQIHEWSGKNSILERFRAATGLAEWLKKSIANHPEATQVVIAHSHGGNIVLQALKQLPPEFSVFIVTLATPFLQITPVASFKQASQIFGMISLGVLIAVIHLEYKIHLAYGFSWKILSVVVLLSVLSYLLVMISFHLVTNLGKTQEMINATSRGLNWHLKNKTVFTIKGGQDEAALGLAAGEIANWLSMFVITLMMKLNNLLFGRWKLIWFLPSVVVLAMITYGYTTGKHPTQILALFPYNLFFTVLWLPGILSLLMIFMGGLFRSVYGREFLIGAWLCEANVHSAPDTGINVYCAADMEINEFYAPPSEIKAFVVTLVGPTSTPDAMRHSIYNHKDCAPVVIMALKAAAGKPT
jgi:hypothetical protein